MRQWVNAGVSVSAKIPIGRDGMAIRGDKDQRVLARHAAEIDRHTAKTFGVLACAVDVINEQSIGRFSIYNHQMKGVGGSGITVLFIPCIRRRIGLVSNLDCSVHRDVIANKVSLGECVITVGVLCQIAIQVARAPSSLQSRLRVPASAADKDEWKGAVELLQVRVRSKGCQVLGKGRYRNSIVPDAVCKQKRVGSVRENVLKKLIG